MVGALVFSRLQYKFAFSSLWYNLVFSRLVYELAFSIYHWPVVESSQFPQNTFILDRQATSPFRGLSAYVVFGFVMLQRSIQVIPAVVDVLLSDGMGSLPLSCHCHDVQKQKIQQLQPLSLPEIYNSKT